MKNTPALVHSPTPRRAALTAAQAAAVKPPAAGRLHVADGLVPGLLLRVTAANARTWALKYRPKGGRSAEQRTVTLGDASLLSLAEARTRARQLLAQVAGGADPVADAKAAAAAAAARETLAQVAPRFLAMVERTRSAQTLKAYRGALARYILPAFGSAAVADVTRAQVGRWHLAMAATPVAANRAVACLGALMTWAQREGIRPESAPSPTRGLVKYREAPRSRFLATAEVVRLGAALAQAEREGLPPAPNRRTPEAARKPATIRGPYRRHAPVPVRPADPFAVAAIRLQLLTGWRAGEVVALRWSDVDLERGVVAHHTKGGHRVRPLGAPALELLASLPRVGPCVFPSPRDPAHPMGKPDRLWYAVRHAAGLDHADGSLRVHLHDLRHSHAATAASAGESLVVVGALLGHATATMTQRYAHLTRGAVAEAADRTAGALAELLDAGARQAAGEVPPATAVRPLRRGRAG